MKFWNKQHKVRHRCWTRVELPHETGGLVGREYHGWMQRGPFTDLFTELQNNPGKGKFYMMILKKEIWFERGADASWFVLTHL